MAAKPKTSYVCPGCGGSDTNKCKWSGEIGLDDEYQGLWIECQGCGLQGPLAVWDHMARRRTDIERALGGGKELSSQDRAYTTAIEQFGYKMYRELKANDPKKGNFLEWKPNADGAASEMEHHYIKLIAAIGRGKKHEISELCADTANTAMGIDRALGTA